MKIWGMKHLGLMYHREFARCLFTAAKHELMPPRDYRDKAVPSTTKALEAFTLDATAPSQPQPTAGTGYGPIAPDSYQPITSDPYQPLSVDSDRGVVGGDGWMWRLSEEGYDCVIWIGGMRVVGRRAGCEAWWRRFMVVLLRFYHGREYVWTHRARSKMVWSK